MRCNDRNGAKCNATKLHEEGEIVFKCWMTASSCISTFLDHAGGNNVRLDELSFSQKFFIVFLLGCNTDHYFSLYFYLDTWLGTLMLGVDFSFKKATDVNK